MGLGQYMAKEIMKEICNMSKEFYEFVMPAIDMVEDGNDLMVTIDYQDLRRRISVLR